MATSGSPSDTELATAASGGDRAAFELLVTRHGGDLLGVIEARTGDHHRAVDLTQEIWVKVHRGLARWKPTGSWRSWLFSVAFNHLRDDVRARDRRPIVYLDDFRGAAPEPTSDPIARVDERAAVHAALQRVDEKYRAAVELVDLAGLSYDEAATTLGCRTGTVKSRVNRGRLAFRDHYLRLTGSSSPASAHGAQP